MSLNVCSFQQQAGGQLGICPHCCLEVLALTAARASVATSAETPSLLAVWHYCWPACHAVPSLEVVVQQRSVRPLLLKGKQSPVALSLHSHNVPFLEPSLFVGCLLWKQRCRRAAGRLFMKHVVCSYSSFEELLLASTWVVHRWLPMEWDSRVQPVVTGSVVVCRERRVSLGSVETKEIQENR